MSEDVCGDYDGPERRKHCELVVVVNQRFSDFMERYEADQKKHKEDHDETMNWRKSTLATIGELKTAVDNMSRPYKIVIWISTIATGAFLVEGIKLLIGFVRSKIHFY